MLLFNPGSAYSMAFLLSDLKTSYVIVQPLLKYIDACDAVHLKTSYVIVQQIPPVSCWIR